MKRRDLNELYNMVCNDRYEYTQAVQAVVNFSGLQGEELTKVLPTYTSQTQPELTIHDVRGYTPYYERDDVIMGGGSFVDMLLDIDPIMPQGSQDDYLIVTDNEIDLYTANSDFQILP
jgi:hypothetical protein